MSKKLFAVLALLVVASMLLVACGPGEEPVDNTPAEDTTTNTTNTTDTTAEDTTTEDEPAAEETGPRMGGYLDTVAMSVVGADSAVTQIEAGAIDLYGSNLSTPQDFEAIEAAGLERSFQFGIFYEITFNPVGPTFEGTGKLNPFSSAKIREAMNWLIDRDLINQEIYGGAAVNKWFPLVSGFPDYAKYIDLIRPLEVKYAYNKEKAVEVITSEMEAMGATLEDGKWMYDGEQVELIFLIRTDSDGTRRPMGDMISNWLEEVGFVVDRQYKTSSEASPLWVLGNPQDGSWHMYTGAWGVGGVQRDEGDNFQFYYTQQSAYAFSPLWQAYDVSEDDLAVTEALANKTFTNLDERRDLMSQALDLIFKYSYRVWVADGRASSAWIPEVSVSYDLAAGVDINTLWPYTLRLDDQVGGLVKYGEPDLFVDPANPVAGSNWTYDSVWQLPTSDWDAIPNPYTGLSLPQRLESAEVTVLTGLPVSQTYDWVTLDFADEIVPPDDAWINWDVESETFLTIADWKAASELVAQVEAQAATLAEGADFAALTTDSVSALVSELAAFHTETTGNAADVTGLLDAAVATPEPAEDEEEPETRSLMQIRIDGIAELATAEEQQAELADYLLEFVAAADKALFDFTSYDYTSATRKVVYHYPEGMYEDMVWHDGSNMSAGDFVMTIIMGYAVGLEGSPLYDASQAPVLESALSTFKGVKIVSTDPLVIESYSDTWEVDAENNAVLFRAAYWPEYGYGQGSWAMMAVANKAEESGELAYSADKADAQEVEWMNFIGGPSLDILSAKLDEAAAESYIPFAPTMSQFVTEEEAATRYANIKSFYEDHGHFWIGTGPYILDEVFLVEKTGTLVHNPNYPDPADKWAQFSEPKLAEVAIDGAGRATIGEEATFDVFVTAFGEAYPADEVSEVKYLLFDATNALVATGEAEFIADGQYMVTLSADETAALEAGATKLEIAVVVIPVSIPTIADFEFVVE